MRGAGTIVIDFIQCHPGSRRRELWRGDSSHRPWARQRIQYNHQPLFPRKKTMKKLVCIAAAATLFALAAPASAQFAKPEDAIKYRQSAMFVMGTHFGRIGAMVNGKAPYDAKVAETSAAVVADMSKLPWPGFIPGTDKGGNTKAKPEIWTDQAKFKENNDKLMAQTPKLAAAAKTGDLETLKTAFSATADICKSCHDDFRNK
jgi:cytochrome c556